MIERASGLLAQGNIGAARIVLERAAESGNARASFVLAETYDPVILSAWAPMERAAKRRKRASTAQRNTLAAFRRQRADSMRYGMEGTGLYSRIIDAG
jgi:hypothetical protein